MVEHPFIERWVAGELAWEDLRTFASEYDHAVVALAAAAQRAAEFAEGRRPHELAALAAEQAEAVEDWRAFARAVGWGGRSAWYYGAEPLAETVACARAWAGARDRPLASHVAVLQAVRRDQARLSAVLEPALGIHYGIAGGAATAWFRAVHGGANAAFRHRTLADVSMSAADARAAADALDAHVALLDGLELCRAHAVAAATSSPADAFGDPVAAR